MAQQARFAVVRSGESESTHESKEEGKVGRSCLAFDEARHGYIYTQG